MSKPVILLNGPSSSGKSTLAKALQEDLYKKGLRYDVISIDDFLKMTLKDKIYEDDVYEISEKLCIKGLELLASSDGLIIDHVITSERIWKELLNQFSEYEQHFVHVTCPLDVLKKREQERHNRCVGSAESSYQYLYPQDGYEITIDTHKIPNNKCVEYLESLLK